jgi:hypothetical protein
LVVDLQIPSNIVSISAYAFIGGTRIESITLTSVKQIHDSAISGCTGIVTAKLGYDLEEIGTWVFSNNASLVDVYIHSTVLKSIGNYAFNNCTKLKNVYSYVPGHIQHEVEIGPEGNSYFASANFDYIVE